MLNYTGRFAPSPSGPLHLGSLTAALASYLQARKQGGRWLLRIEDLDPPREPTGAAASILQCLEAHQLHHDGPVSYQSQHHRAYEHALQHLREQDRLYACKCTRATLRATAYNLKQTAYSGRCREARFDEHNCALRLKLAPCCVHRFDDQIFGVQQEDLRQSCGDFVLRRRDGLYAYQLAVVVDDALQGVSEVVRGADLLDNSARQIHLQQALEYPQPSYLHVPIVRDQQGQKLSKQNHAPALDLSRALHNLECAWTALGQAPLPRQSACSTFLQLAQSRWSLGNLQQLVSI